MKFQNTQTGQIVDISNLKRSDSNPDFLVSSDASYQPGARFCAKWSDWLEVHKEEGGELYFTTMPNVQICSKQRTHKPQPQPTEPAPAPAQDTPAPVAPSQSAVVDAFAALTPLFAGVQANVQNAVMSELKPVIEKLQRQAMQQSTRIELVAPDGERHEVEGVFCDEFEDMVQDVNDGFYPYLWGAAGCGKTHTAEQVAKVLGLDFYPQTTVQFAHDVKGYGDAAGKLVQTSFFKAFADEAHGGKGGLYFQDEYDRSYPEAAIVLNTALANGYYDFPVVGRVYAHPKFRFMAAGNTRMTGADEEYVTGQVQDASSRDRVIYYEMHYDRRVELPCIANGDEELVDFVEDVRQSIAAARISHVVSYRETRYMAARSDKKAKALIRSTFKGLEQDAIRIIYGGLQNKENAWAKAMKELV